MSFSEIIYSVLMKLSDLYYEMLNKTYTTFSHLIGYPGNFYFSPDFTGNAFYLDYLYWLQATPVSDMITAFFHNIWIFH